jgi:hypothetical protein
MVWDIMVFEVPNVKLRPPSGKASGVQDAPIVLAASDDEEERGWKGLEEQPFKGVVLALTGVREKVPSVWIRV